MSKLVPPHGSSELRPLLLEGEARAEELNKAQGLKKVPMTTRETSDLIMMGIGAFTPLTGFMGQADWEGVCKRFKLASGVFWPIPITFSATPEAAEKVNIGDEIALYSDETAELMGTM